MENIDIIDSSGDVILILHREEDGPDLKLKVNSKILSLASPIFHHMFDGRFAEGQNLSAATPKEILLPSDKANLMQMLCLLVHFRCSRLPRTVDIETLADFAVLCDKYQCIEAAGWMSRGWVTSWLPHPKTANFEKLLFVTYVLGLPDEFNQVTRLLILNHTFDLDIGSAMHGFDFLPGQIFSM
ncbi:hypothetical protein B0J11DRAFT_434683 [Dendryphion nanum]|uniref:BTB domain-containing protein n=1 Tax=Dendryphion nanum TaxID=256645 RepID=A0A9P9DV13_9PLEO|nr:hypothetical protein B0J11DRAFT_434683 [Dendryphion nanum]